GPAVLLALMLLGIRVLGGQWSVTGVRGQTLTHERREGSRPLTTDPPSGATPTPTQGCGPAWRLVDSPNSGSGNNDLYGIAALSATDIWAVGGAGSETLTMHWDGTQWSIVPSPSAGALYGVTALSSDNVWAAGYIGEFPGPYQTVIDRWDVVQWTE